MITFEAMPAAVPLRVLVGGKHAGIVIMERRGDDLVVVLAVAAGEGVTEAVDAFARDVAAGLGCTGVACHTMRPGLVRKMIGRGYTATVRREVDRG